MTAPEANSEREPAVIRWIWAELAPRTKLGVGGAVVLALTARTGALAAAWLYAAGDPRAAAATAVGAASVFVARRVTATWARLDVERDLTVAASRSLLRADVIEEPDAEPHFALTSGLYYATDAAANTLPAMVADVVAAVLAALLLARVLPSDLLSAGVVGAFVVASVTVLLRARIAMLHEGATRAQEKLGDALAATVEGRLELVAASVEGNALARVTDAADRYRAASRRAVLGTALIGRAPVGAAILVGGAMMAVGSRESWTLGLPSLVVLGAALPPILGVVFGAQELWRLTKRLAPFAKVAMRPPRPELSTRAKERELSLSRLAFDRVDFAYEVGGDLALEGVSFEWLEGTAAVILRGPNGSGKSTILRLLVGLRDPTAGRVSVDGSDLRDLDRAAVRRRVAYLPQRSYLGEPYTTVSDSIQLIVPGATREVMSRALERTGLAALLAKGGYDPLERRIGELSIGQRQRLALARVLCREVDVVLLDEPDANLDQRGMALLVDVIEELRLDGRIVAVAAHGALSDLPNAVTWELPGRGPRV